MTHCSKKHWKLYAAGNNRRGRELINQMEHNKALMQEVKDYANSDASKQIIKEAGIRIISKTDAIPHGYVRNSFSNTTILLMQEPHLPEFNILAVVEHNSMNVHEDPYLVDKTTRNLMYSLHAKSLYAFCGKIHSRSSIVDTIRKIQRNALFQIIDVLTIDVTKDFLIMELLHFFENCTKHKFLFDVTICHSGKKYSLEEKQKLKTLFLSTK